MLPHESTSSSSSFSTEGQQSMSMSIPIKQEDEFNSEMEVDVKLEFKEELEEEEEKVYEQEIHQRISQFLNEPDECANGSNFAPEQGQVEMKEETRKDESVHKNQNQNQLKNNIENSDSEPESESTSAPFRSAPCPKCGITFASQTTSNNHIVHCGINSQYKDSDEVSNKSFKCDSCAYTTNKSCNLKEHRKKHNKNASQKKTEFNCSEPNCSYKNADRKQVKYHEFTKHKRKDGVKISKCPYEFCLYETARGASLVQKHVNSVHLKVRKTHKKPRKQVEALLKSVHSSSLPLSDSAVHISNPESESQQQLLLIEATQFHMENSQQNLSKPIVKCFTIFYHCDHCDFYTKEDQKLAIHLFNEHNLPRVILKELKPVKDEERKLPEDENFSLDLQSSTQKEKEVEIPRSLFKCSEPNCNYSNPKKYTVTCHEFFRHGKRGDLKILTCSFCSYETPQKYKMKLHADSAHQRFKKFRCDVKGCFHKTTSRGNLNNHRNNVHLGLKKVSCDYCSLEISRKSGNLRRHIEVTHFQLRPFKCHEIGCEYTAKRKGPLERHLKTLHIMKSPGGNKTIHNNLPLLETSSASGSGSVIIKQEKEEEVLGFGPDQP